MTDDMDQEIFDEFIIESREQLDEMESNLVELDASRARGEALDEERINATFRAFHSMKGSGSYLGFSHLASVAHRAESLLDLIRSGERELTDDNVTILCDTIDCCRNMLGAVESDHSDASKATEAGKLLTRLQAMLDDPSEEAVAVEAAPSTPAEVTTDPAEEEEEQASKEAPAPSASATTEASAAEASATEDGSGAPSGGLDALALALNDTSPVDDDPLQDEDEDEDEAEVEPKAAPSAALPAKSAPAPEKAPAPSKTPSNGSSNSAKEADQSIRVGLDKLDMLMNLVGELIIAENMVTHNQDLEGHELPNFTKAATQLNRITRNLQDLAMSVRMVPIAPMFRKMMRVARDVARKQHKDVQVALSGEETEVDKRVIEAITDPLVHLLRNAVDHGVETPEKREKAGKQRSGTIHLEARHEAGDVWIVIRDDGAGIDREGVIAKARERGLIEGTGESLPDSQVFALIFEPGFSTAAQVTDVSGRGVGMDVVKRNIEELNGRIDVSSAKGEGTTIALRIPLTMAIVEGMLARVGAHTYAVPMLSVREIVSYDPTEVTTLADGTQLLNSRGAAVPIVHLSDLHGHAHDHGSEKGVLVIVEDDGQRLCLFVDQIIGQRQTVIKALPSYLGHLSGLSGCSILNSGDISLILDVREVITETAVAPSRNDATRREAESCNTLH